MPMMGAKDSMNAKPRIPKERTERGVVILSANAVASGTVLSFQPGATANLSNGMFANGVNVGATVGVVGFNLTGGPTIVNLTANQVTLSAAVSGAINAGQQITFSKAIKYKPNTLANGIASSYNANTYLVSTTRTANANSILHNAQAAIGWNYVTVGSGYVKAIQWKNAGNQASNGYINFYPNAQYDQLGTGINAANASYTVNANGAITSITVNYGGRYNFTPFANVPFTGLLANTSNAVLTVIMGGRANRVQVETLAVISNTATSDPLSGGPWYPGL